MEVIKFEAFALGENVINININVKQWQKYDLN